MTDAFDKLRQILGGQGSPSQATTAQPQPAPTSPPIIPASLRPLQLNARATPAVTAPTTRQWPSRLKTATLIVVALLAIWGLVRFGLPMILSMDAPQFPAIDLTGWAWAIVKGIFVFIGTLIFIGALIALGYNKRWKTFAAVVVSAVIVSVLWWNWGNDSPAPSQQAASAPAETAIFSPKEFVVTKEWSPPIAFLPGGTVLWDRDDPSVGYEHMLPNKTLIPCPANLNVCPWVPSTQVIRVRIIPDSSAEKVTLYFTYLKEVVHP